MKRFQIYLFCCFVILFRCLNGQQTNESGKREVRLLDDDFVLNKLNNNPPQAKVKGRKRKRIVKQPKLKIIPVDKVKTTTPNVPKKVRVRKELYEKQNIVKTYNPKAKGNASPQEEAVMKKGRKRKIIPVHKVTTTTPHVPKKVRVRKDLYEEQNILKTYHPKAKGNASPQEEAVMKKGPKRKIIPVHKVTTTTPNVPKNVPLHKDLSEEQDVVERPAPKVNPLNFDPKDLPEYPSENEFDFNAKKFPGEQDVVEGPDPQLNDNASPQEDAVMENGPKSKIIPVDEVTTTSPNVPKNVPVHKDLSEEQDVVERPAPKVNPLNFDPIDLPEYQSENEFDFNAKKFPGEQDVVEGPDPQLNDNASPQEEAVMENGPKSKIIPVDEVTTTSPNVPKNVPVHKDLSEEQDVVERPAPKVNPLNFDPIDLPEYQSENEFDFNAKKFPGEQDVVEGPDPQLNDNASAQEDAVMENGPKSKIIPVDEVTTTSPNVPKNVPVHKDLSEEQDVVERPAPKVNRVNFDPNDLPDFQSEDEDDFHEEDEFGFDAEEDMLPPCIRAELELIMKDIPDEEVVVDLNTMIKVNEMMTTLVEPIGNPSHKLNLGIHQIRKRRALKTHHAHVNAMADAKFCRVCEQRHLPIHQCWQAYHRKVGKLQIQHANYIKLKYNQRNFFAVQLANYVREDQHLNIVLEEVANIGDGNVTRRITDARRPMEFFGHVPKSLNPSKYHMYIKHPYIRNLRKKVEALSLVEPFRPLSKRNTVIHLKTPLCRWMSLGAMEVMRFLRIKDKSLPCQYVPPIQIDNVFMRRMTPLEENNGFLFMPPPLTKQYVRSFERFRLSGRRTIDRFYNLYSWVTHTRLWGTCEFRHFFFFRAEKEYNDKNHLPTMLKHLGNMHSDTALVRFTLYLMSRYFMGEAYLGDKQQDSGENYDIFYVTPFQCRQIKAEDIDPDITPHEYKTVALTRISTTLGNILASREFLFLYRSVLRYRDRMRDYIKKNEKIIEEGRRKMSILLRSTIVRNPAFLAFIEFYFDPKNEKEVRKLQRNYQMTMGEAKNYGKI